MPYTRKSLALVWVILAVLFGLGGAGVLEGPWRMLLVLAALAAPVLLRSPAAATVTAHRRSRDIEVGRNPAAHAGGRYV